MNYHPKIMNVKVDYVTAFFCLIALVKVPFKDLRKRLFEPEWVVNILVASEFSAIGSLFSFASIFTFWVFISILFGQKKSRPGYLGSALSQSSLFL